MTPSGTRTRRPEDSTLSPTWNRVGLRHPGSLLLRLLHLVHFRLRRLLKRLRDLPRLAEGAEGVQAEDLVDVPFGVAALEEFLGQPRVGRDVLEADGPGGDAVEVGPD